MSRAHSQQQPLEQPLRARRRPSRSGARGWRARARRVALARLAPVEARGPAGLHAEDLAERPLRALGVRGRRIRRQAHHLVLVLAELHAQREGDERVEGAERAGRARRRLVADEVEPPSGRGGGAQAVARSCHWSARAPRARRSRIRSRRRRHGRRDGRGRRCGPRRCRGARRPTAEPLALRDAELPARGVHEAELGAPASAPSWRARAGVTATRRRSTRGRRPRSCSTRFSHSLAAARAPASATTSISAGAIPSSARSASTARRG